jgi:hypothetical protein
MINLYARYSICWGNPNRVNYHTRFPLPEGSRDCFPKNVIRTIHIGIDGTISPRLRAGLESA